MCFKNATDLVLNDGSLIYCEGYSIGIIPVVHAWCITKTGEVIDPTWQRADKTGKQYFGIAFKRNWLMHSLLKYQYYGLIDQWHSGYPILKEDEKEWKHPINEQ